MDFVKNIFNTFLVLFIKLISRALRLLIIIKKRLTGDIYNEKLHKNLVIESTKYDMVTSANEPYYQEQYWHWIAKHIINENLPNNGNYLDIGCGQGRLSIPLAEWCSKSGGKVTGVDFSKTAIETANQYINKIGLSNVEYHNKDILEFVKSAKDNSYDAILFIEVSFFMPDYKSVLKEAKRILKPNGLLFASFRPQYFDALCVIKNNFWDDINIILKERKGKLFNSDAVFTWQTSKEIYNLMEQSLQFKTLDLLGIGCCSGIKGDPHSFVMPSILDESKKKSLMELEIALAHEIPDAGRYMLYVGRNIKSKI